MYSLQGVYALCIMITDFKINIFLSSPQIAKIKHQSAIRVTEVMRI